MKPYTFLSNLMGIFLACWSLAASAQPDNLIQDRPFFEQQAQLYQQWMDREGIGRHLMVRELDVKSDHLSMYLQFRYANLDSMVSAWDQIKTQAETHTKLSLEEQLFYKMALLMEVRQANVDVQLYNTYDLREEPLFFRGIYFDSDSGKVLVETSDPRSEIRYINLPAANLSTGDGGAVTLVDHTGNQRNLFDQIISFAKERYTRAICEHRRPKFQLLEEEHNLRFRIQDLCRVVLVDETQPLLCALGRSIGFDCNHIAREMLEFTFTYEPTYSGAKLEIRIDGKFGSGFFDEVKRGAYHDMELEPRFRPYLKDFADQVKLHLQQYLRR